MISQAYRPSAKYNLRNILHSISIDAFIISVVEMSQSPIERLPAEILFAIVQALASPWSPILQTSMIQTNYFLGSIFFIRSLWCADDLIILQRLACVRTLLSGQLSDGASQTSRRDYFPSQASFLVLPI
jgi:hypothetical protein